MNIHYFIDNACTIFVEIAIFPTIAIVVSSTLLTLVFRLTNTFDSSLVYTVRILAAIFSVLALLSVSIKSIMHFAFIAWR